MRTKGFCSALLRCGEIKLIAEKRGASMPCHFGPYREYRENEAAPNKILRVRNLVSPYRMYRMCPASFSFSG